MVVLALEIIFKNAMPNFIEKTELRNNGNFWKVKFFEKKKIMNLNLPRCK